MSAACWVPISASSGTTDTARPRAISASTPPRSRKAATATALPPTQHMHINGERVDRPRIEPIRPRRHYACAAVSNGVDDGSLVRAAEPDAVGQIGSAKVLVAFGVLTVATGAAIRENRLAFGDIDAWTHCKTGQ